MNIVFIAAVIAAVCLIFLFAALNIASKSDDRSMGDGQYYDSWTNY